MKRSFIFLALVAALALAVDTLARGPGGGGGGGGRGGGGFGGGGGRSFGGGGFGGGGFSGGHTPSFGGGFSGGRPTMAGGGARPSFVPQSRPANFGGGNQQNFAGAINRPNFSGGNIASNNRPTIVNRPTFSGGDRPNLGMGDRPNIGGVDRPNMGQGNRPGLGIGDRPGIGTGTRPDWAGNRPDGGNRPNRPGDRDPNWNRNGNWNNNINRWANNGNRSWNRPWYNHYDHFHNDFHHGRWNYWGGWYPWVWYGAGAVGWWSSPYSEYAYDNPFYVEPEAATDLYYPDYSQPIPPPDEELLASGEATYDNSAGAVTAASANADNDPNTAQAVAIFDSGRALFKNGDFQGALDKVDQAIKLLPSDATLHEFRALCLFAMKRYQEAAAGIYAVLAAGPGWDWDTLKALYPDTAVYTAQLRGLEEYKKANPNAPDASFLLAYHYLVMGYPDQAAKELQQVVKLQPDDKLAAAILDALQKRNQPQPQQAPTPQEM